MRGTRRFRRLRWLLVPGILLLLVVIDYFAYPRWCGMGGRSFNAGENGLWVRYTAYFGQRSPDEMAQLAQRLRDGGIRNAYCHVRYIRSDGTLRYRFPTQARALVNTLHRLAPGTKVYAWIYVGAEDEYPPVKIADPGIRQAMVREAAWLVNTCGFDGIQWDYEICRNGNPHLLSLLEETRAALPAGTPISVCTPPWYFRPVPRWWYGWDERYFAAVAAHCDEIAVMGYDTGMFLPRSYVWFMRRQAVHVTRAVARGNPRCRVILGVPTYEGGGGWGHTAHAETLHLALKGVREGLADHGAVPGSFAGIALFADYTTSPAEWADYRRSWAGR